ncbi:hypothetical protein NMU03_01460 [Allocoprobacillus halotolerans]|uniref:Uncharacterized protein n=1 Tax=Allocoprobacillus halotolerans TaxID=2944914 RepID=A0ABY5I388_9FIRM|nr:hypothetical protein [Allocoprobacillus halotolerans]UTY39530.1 hypothetical protein NMU03_01460 [Allocoprobacillus halotolerans]
MKKAKKIIFALLCVFTIGAVSLNSAFAAVTEHYSQSATVSGGKITAHATYYQSEINDGLLFGHIYYQITTM